MHEGTSRGWRWALPPLFALVAVVVFASLYQNYALPKAERVYLTPMFHDQRGWELFTMEDGARADLTARAMLECEGTVYLSRKMDAEFERRDLTILELDRRPTVVFLDGSPIYSTEPGAGCAVGAVRFSALEYDMPAKGEFIRLSLPPDCAGRMLTIATRNSPHDGTPMVRLSSEAINTLEIAATTSAAAIPASAFAIVALLLLGLFLYGGFMGQWHYPLVLLMGAAAAQCLFFLYQYEYLSADFGLNMPLSAFFEPLMCYLPMGYVVWNMKRRRIACALALLPWVLVAFFEPVCNLLRLYGPWFDCLPYAIYPALSTMLIFSFMELRDGSPFFHRFMPAMGAMVLGGAAVYALSDQYRPLIRMMFTFAMRPNELIYCVGTVLLVLGAGVAFVLIMRRTAQIETEISVLRVKDEMIERSMEATRARAQELAAARHDMLHHLSAMDGMCRAGENERLGQYIRQLADDTCAIAPLRVTAHPTVNAILTTMYARAQSTGVELTCNVQLPGTLSIPDVDLSAFLMNMLDNALNAASHPDARGRRYVECTMRVKGRYLFIEAKNAFDGAAAIDRHSGLPLSRRGAGHGYGMKTMREIARRYQSELEIEADANAFTVRTALLMP